ncbi:hypothetical protein WHR41_07436 [Cladosporium halotolerans]|uniref:PNPLA domain-containing protein n=1 Tax=Cladosporium halotolerans TaxID=1052096 RepID=A0AB34KGS9_9PEZI
MEDNARLRRKDTTKGPPLRILSLDGGGVRGYSMLIILQELMHRTFVEIEGRAPKRHEIPKPADHFDLIAGTGTGGLIAIMLGRLRLDIDTCKDLYVRLTRRVFETDKTIAGIPYKSTLFKASKLEEAIREVVREHTLHGSEGNDTVSQAGMTPDSPRSQMSGGAESSIPSRTMSQASRYSQVGLSPVNPPRNFGVTGRWGNANALLYDAREARTKTAVTAMFAGKRSTGSSVMLRSYDSRKEPASDVNCTIWQAGRATSATGLAFKPIQIGQTTYHDEGSGKFNPAPQVLDEAVLNEWPGREVGVFVSIGTGKRPSGTSEKQHEWWEGFMGGTLGNFAEARRRLIAKIEGCEDTHQYMMHEHLGARHVSPENYYRLNVEVGVGEFGMNEWDRLGDISTGTRMYLGKSDVQSINLGASAKLARVHFAKKRLERTARGQNGPGSLSGRHSWQNGYDQPSPSGQEIPLPSNPMAVELPGSDPSFLPAAPPPRPSYEHRPSVADMKYTVVSSDEFPQPADDPHNTSDATTPTQQSYAHSHHRSYSHNYHSHNPSSATSLHSPYQSPTYPPHRLSADYSPPPALYQAPPPVPGAPPPPLPPKTPLPYPDDTSPISPPSAGTQPSPRMGNGPATFMNMGELRRNLPYPVSGAEEGLLRGGGEGPPPSVNMRSKPSLAR